MPSPRCPFCHAPSAAFLEGRPDREYGVPDRLEYHRCSSCGVVFADPIPEDSISSFYVNYSTHGERIAQKPGFFARGARALTLREFASASSCQKDEPVLDYGCGDGSFLAELGNKGYTSLVGYDFDPPAREAARSSGATIAEGEEDLAAHGPFATITLNHVIEHVPHPAQDLARLAGMLKPGGRLILRTPNARSILSKRFGASWRGWETPRHLHVFTPAGFEALAALPALSGLSLVQLSTSEAMYLGIFHESLHGEAWRRPALKVARHALALTSLVALAAANKFTPIGEEIVAVFERKSS